MRFLYTIATGPHTFRAFWEPEKSYNHLNEAFERHGGGNIGATDTKDADDTIHGDELDEDADESILG